MYENDRLTYGESTDVPLVHGVQVCSDDPEDDASRVAVGIAGDGDDDDDVTSGDEVLASWDPVRAALLNINYNKTSSGAILKHVTYILQY